MDLRSLPIFALVGMVGLALGACDRAIDDRYAGLVVIPVEEVPLDELPEDQAEAGALNPIYELVSTDIPRVRPDRIPERESTPAQAANAANLAQAQAQAVNDEAAAAENALAAASQNEQEALAALAQAEAALASLNGSLAQNESGGLPLEGGTIPRARPSNFPRSYEEVEAFVAAQARAQEAEARQAEARQAEEENLAQQAAQAQREAQAAQAARVEAEQRAAEERGRQLEAETAAQQAQNEAARLATVGATLPPTIRVSSVPATGPAAQSLAVPLSYANAPPLTNITDLQALFDEASYDLARVVGGTPVPALILQRLPGEFRALGETNPPLHRELFIKTVLPLCLVTNGRIVAERDYVLASIGTGEDLSRAADPVIRGMGAKFNTQSRLDLLTRVEPIPISLCLAQAIVASDWGRDQKALDQNALFGPFVRDPNTPSVSRPATSNLQGAPEVLFNSLQSATDAYALHLNRDPGLAGFRDERARAALQSRALSGSVAAEFMTALAPDNPELVARLIQVIREHQLSQYDLARLDNTRQAVPVL